MVVSLADFSGIIHEYSQFPWRATASSSISWKMPYGEAVSPLREDGTDGWHVVQHLSPTAYFCSVRKDFPSGRKLHSGSQPCVGRARHPFVGPCNFSRR